MSRAALRALRGPRDGASAARGDRAEPRARRVAPRGVRALLEFLRVACAAPLRAQRVRHARRDARQLGARRAAPAGRLVAAGARAPALPAALAGALPVRDQHGPRRLPCARRARRRPRGLRARAGAVGARLRLHVPPRAAPTRRRPLLRLCRIPSAPPPHRRVRRSYAETDRIPPSETLSREQVDEAQCK